MEEQKHRRWLRIFKAVAALVLAQVIWWTYVFLRDVSVIEGLKIQVLESTTMALPAARDAIVREAFHQRLMFLSESAFFVFMACLAFVLLYRALRAEQRSREIQRNFIEIVTHESKTPLTAMKLRLESVNEKFGSDPLLAREIGLALEEVRRLVSIFEKTMSLIRMQSSTFRFEPVSLAEVVESVARRLEPVFRARGVALSLDLDAEQWVNGDAQYLQNSVQSLLENAVYYNPGESKKISVSVKPNGARVVLDVVDNGPGIAEDDRKGLFQRFHRGSGSSRVPGTGLGLYLVKQIVEAHGGTVRLARSGTDGSHFEIELPKVVAS